MGKSYGVNPLFKCAKAHREPFSHTSGTNGGQQLPEGTIGLLNVGLEIRYSGRDRHLPTDYSQGLRGSCMHMRSMGVYHQAR